MKEYRVYLDVKAEYSTTVYANTPEEAQDWAIRLLNLEDCTLTSVNVNKTEIVYE